ncbi:hypothetical protein, partial [Pontibacter chitinilyticus]|uniref:hypothetical protein n=1 Tax=Pontibacter chitinilyticus TaxID=2674989 RepID=UPI00321B9EE8
MRIGSHPCASKKPSKNHHFASTLPTKSNRPANGKQRFATVPQPGGGFSANRCPIKGRYNEIRHLHFQSGLNVGFEASPILI